MPTSPSTRRRRSWSPRRAATGHHGAAATDDEAGHDDAEATEDAETSPVAADPDDDGQQRSRHRRPGRRRAGSGSGRRGVREDPQVRVTLRLLLGGVVAGALVWLTGAPAAAHASLVSSDPESGAVVAALPDEITLTFNEPVRLEAGGVKAFDANGDEWEVDAVSRDNLVVVTPVGDPGDGTVVISWKVTSEDGHEVGGAVHFSIGEASAGGPAVRRPQRRRPPRRWRGSPPPASPALGLLLVDRPGAAVGRRARPCLERRPRRRRPARPAALARDRRSRARRSDATGSRGSTV